MPTPYALLRGTAEHGKVEWDHGEAIRWAKILGNLEGRRIEVTVRREQKKRSLNQNAYYWAVVVAMIAEAAGYQPEEAHQALKWQFLQLHGDGALPTVKSTSDLSTVEFEEYMSSCRQLGAEMYHIYVPEPNECL